MTSDRYSLATKLSFGEDLSSEVFCVRYSFDCQLLAAGYGDSSVRVYNANNGRLSFNLSSLEAGSTAKIAKLPVTCLRFRPPTAVHKTRNVLLAAYSEGVIQHWHVTSSKLLSTIVEEGNQIYCVDYRRDALKFATAGKDFSIRVYDESTRQCELTMNSGYDDVTAGHSNRVYALKFVPHDQDLIMTGGWDNTIQIWDTRSQNSVRSIYGPHICGDSLDIIGNEILAGSWRPENSLQLYDFGTGKLIRTIPWSQDESAAATEPCLLYSAQFKKGDGELIAAGGSGANEMKVFERKNGHFVGRVSMKNSIYTVDFDYEGKNIALAGGSAGIKIVEITDIIGNNKSNKV